MNYTLFIARRLFSAGDANKRVSRPAIVIATSGVALGLAVMIVSVCVVLGFKSEIRNKVVGFGSHIQVVNLLSLSSAESQPIRFSADVLNDIHAVRGVKHLQTFCEKAGMLKTDDAFRGVMFRGVGRSYDTSFIKAHLVEGDMPSFSDSSSCNKVLISRQLALQLKVKLEDKVYAYFFDDGVRARRLTIAGIYETHMENFDNSIVLTDLYTCQKLCGYDAGQFSGLEILVSDFSRLDDIDHDVSMKLRMRQDSDGAYFAAPTIRQLYPNIFSWLTLLDTNVWVILALMVVVASFTMISGLLIIILERTNFIGVMKALGATNGSLRHLFLYFGVFIIGRGLLIGNILGIGLVLLQQQFGVVHIDPETYYVDTVPMLINWEYIIFLNVSTLLISSIVLILPSFVISHIHPAKSIRFE